jgi:hypothetical protein
LLLATVMSIWVGASLADETSDWFPRVWEIQASWMSIEVETGRLADGQVVLAGGTPTSNWS